MASKKTVIVIFDPKNIAEAVLCLTAEVLHLDGGAHAGRW